MTNLDSILKSRDITLPKKVHRVKVMVLPGVMYGSESWTIKKHEHRRIDAFKLGCWRGLLRVPWTARRSNQSFLKEINPEYSLEGLMMKPKLQYSGHLMQRTDSFEKTVMLGKIEGGRRREHNPEYSLEGLMLKPKLEYSGHLMRRTDSFKKTMMLGKIEGGRREHRGRDGWMASPTQWTWVWVSSRRWWRTGKPGVLQSQNRTQLNKWWVV